MNGIHHVIKTGSTRGKSESYCGRTLWTHDMGITLEHAIGCIEAGTYLQPCKKCMKKFMKMYEFLKQFKAENNWAIDTMYDKSLYEHPCYEEAIKKGYIEHWNPNKGREGKCTYRPALICKLKGRLFVKKNSIKEKIT